MSGRILNPQMHYAHLLLPFEETHFYQRSIRPSDLDRHPFVVDNDMAMRIAYLTMKSCGVPLDAASLRWRDNELFTSYPMTRFWWLCWHHHVSQWDTLGVASWEQCITVYVIWARDRDGLLETRHIANEWLPDLGMHRFTYDMRLFTGQSDAWLERFNAEAHHA